MRDVIIHHSRLDQNAVAHTNAGDILALNHDGGEAYNIVYDHITGLAAGDGIFDMRSNVHDVTFSYNSIAFTVSVSAFSGSASQPRRDISVHHNMWARNSDRMPRIRRNVDTLDFVNNVIYSWDDGRRCDDSANPACKEQGSGATMVKADAGDTPSRVNIVNNYYEAGPTGDPDEAIVYGTGGPDEGPSQDGAKGHKIIEHIKFKDMSNLKLAQMGLELIQEALERNSE